MDEYFDILDLSLHRIDVVWDARYTRLIATAELMEDQARIGISPHSYPMLLPARRVEVVAHEVCHLAAWLLHGHEIDDHGDEWRGLMQMLGFGRPLEEFDLAENLIKKGMEGWPRRRR